MADIFLDIRDRLIRSIVSDSGQIRFQGSYPANLVAETGILHEGELERIISAVRSDSGIGIDQGHLIIPDSEVTTSVQRFPRMPQEEVRKLLARKAAGKDEDDSTRINIVPMDHDQSQQEWLSEHVPADVIRKYKKELSAAKVRLKSVTTGVDSVLGAVSHIRESIFNAHAVFEISTSAINAFFISASSLLQHETVPIPETDDEPGSRSQERTQKRQLFAILDLLHRINSRYQAAHPLNPLQKVWLCGSHPALAGLPEVIQDAMEVETSLLSTEEDAPFAMLHGFWKASLQNSVVNLMHPDLLRRFPLRKRTGMIIYIATALLALAMIASTEYRIKRLKQQSLESKKSLAALKKTQTASPAFIKNLDLLRSLTGKQVLFYPIFRELADKLPEGAYIESFEYQIKDNHNLLTFNAVFAATSDLGDRKTLSKLMDMLDFSTYLHTHQEPTIQSLTKGNQKTMVVKFLCEVTASDTAK